MEEKLEFFEILDDETDHVVGIILQNLIEPDRLRRIPRQSIFHIFRDGTGQSRGAMWHLTCGQLEAKCHLCRLHGGEWCVSSTMRMA